MTDITIRHAEPSDYQAIMEIYNQPSTYGDTLQLPYPSKSTWQQRLEQLSDNDTSLVALVDGIIVGQIGLRVMTSPRRKHVATIGMGVSEPFQGKGIGTALLEAIIDLSFNWLAITRIELEVYADNKAGVALYKKLGFELEGTAKQHAFRNGRYVDSHYMALINA